VTTGVRLLFGDRRYRTVLFVVVGIALIATTVVPLGFLGGSSTRPADGPPLATHVSSEHGAVLHAGSATSIGELGLVPTEVMVGMPAAIAWQALDAAGARATSFAVGCELTVVENANGSSVRAWGNASTTGPLVRSPNGTFSVPSAAWEDGMLGLTVSIASAVPVTLRLFGPLLPTLPAPVTLAVLPDLDHLVLYDHVTTSPPNGSSNDTLWHVRDRFGDPTPGAFLVVEVANASSVSKALVPVTWTAVGTTGAWVNYSTAGRGNGTLTVEDLANTTLLGPVPVSAPGAAAPSPTPSLSPLALLAVALLAVGAVVGMGALLLGGRARPPPLRADGVEELRRLAEGRATVVDLVRRAGALALPEIEAAWEPPPAPPAIADWVASLVTDGTLTVTLGERGQARFALVERPSGKPRVTLDEEALERGIARRDAAVEGDDEETP
jgi:hypothetical protein